MTQRNYEPKTLFHGNNLDFLRGMNSRTVDLIATDPPFNKGRDFHSTPSALKTAGGGSFKDRWKWDRDVHETWVDQIKDDHPALWQVITASRASYGDDMGAFLCFMAVRIIEMHRALKDTGSMYLHCDPTASHYLKQLMDAIFGRRRFLNEIIWCYSTAGRSKTTFCQKHDVILYYSKSKAYTWTGCRVPYPQEEIDRNYRRVDSEGRQYHWRRAKNGVEYVYYADEGKLCNDWWTDIPALHSQSKERRNYPTQKPIDLYVRMIEASSNPGDFVLDPFCGCATTLVAAQKLGREWVGMDIWDEAHEEVIERMRDEGLSDPDGDRAGILPFNPDQIVYTQTPPDRTDILEGDTATPVFYLAQKRIPARWEKLTRAQMVELLAEAQKDGGLITCAGCGRGLESPFMELDHISPKSDGGANHIDNRILLCGPCNRRKSASLTLTGLHRENKKQGWMHDLDKAKAAHERATAKVQKVKEELC